MKSSSGEHYIGLDHVRAFAAYLVWSWHFTHGFDGWPIPFEYAPPLFLLEPLNEGHAGVALFMTLSGYLFAKLLAGRDILFRAFFWNRFVRLVPLLVVILFLAGIERVHDGADLRRYLADVGSGFYKPTLPNGGWSLTIEFHFYLLLPFLLWLGRKSVYPLLGVVVGAICVRTLIYWLQGEVSWLAYWTIVGRIDQFIFGIVAFKRRDMIRDRHITAALIAIAFCATYWMFDVLGGAMTSGSMRSSSPVWILLPTIDGVCFAALISYYDGSFVPQSQGFSWFLGRVGAFSYSIYLFHFFFVFNAAQLFDAYFFPLSNFYVASLAALACFSLMLPIGFLSFRFIEAPFLRLRRPYIRRARKTLPPADGEIC